MWICHKGYTNDHTLFLSQILFTAIFKRLNFLWNICICNIIVFGLQAPLMAPSSQSEDLLDLEQVSLQEASLPPPIQRVMDPGWFTCSHLSWMFFLDSNLILYLLSSWFVSRFFRLRGGSDESWRCRFGGQTGSVRFIHWHDQHSSSDAWGEGLWHLWHR